MKQEWTRSDHISVDITVRYQEQQIMNGERGRFDTRRVDWDSFSRRDLSRSRLEVLELRSVEKV